MLTSLSIVNYAIIVELKLDFSEALNIITGETGAGKSIMLGALSLITGKRADSKILYDKEKKCVVEGIFNEVPKSVNELLEQEGFDVSNELILRREMNPKGKSRAFINDSPSNLNLMERVAFQMLDLNRQFELLDIQSTDFQVDMIDHLAGIEKKSSDYRRDYKSYKQKLNELEKLKNSEGEATKEYDFLKFQLDELNAASLVSGEQKTLEDELNTLQKANAIIELSSATTYQIDTAEESIIQKLRELKHKWEDVSEVNENYKKVYESFQQIESELDELVRDVESSLGSINTDPNRKSELESRLNILYQLLQKHRVKDDVELMQLTDELNSKVTQFESRGSNIKDLENEVSKLQEVLLKKATGISQKREKTFSKVEKKIYEILSALAMPSANIKVENEKNETLGLNGLDQIDIKFSANKGMAAQSIKKVASGGEISRLMLAMKTTVADTMKLPTMIFDEIDTGVSGEVAHRMGQLMSDLAKKHQVIVITHSPQVAAKADKHFHIYKEENKKRTFTKMKELDSESRITEIAKMLSGEQPTKSALSNAKELISAN